MLVPLAAVALALDAVDGWVARRTRTGGDARRALRRRGRRVPDPRPQRVRRPLGRRVGARDRRGALRLPRRRVGAAVDARAAAAALLAQGRRRDAGHRAHGRRRRRPAAGADRGRARRRARPARPSRSAATCGGCGAAGAPTPGRAATPTAASPGRRPDAAGRGTASPRRSRSSPSCSCGPRSSPRPADAPHARARSCGSRSRASSSSPLAARPARRGRGASWPCVVGPVLGAAGRS